MIIFFLLLVEEDIFKPELPVPEVNPDIDWVYRMDRNFINIAFNPNRYWSIDTDFGKLRFLSVHSRDFAEQYEHTVSLKSISYGIKGELKNWNNKRFSEIELWKWIYYRSNLLLGWMKGFYFLDEDTLMYDMGVRYYHSFSSVAIGGWIDYRNEPDYGLIIQYRRFRLEFGRKRKCTGYIGAWGDMRVGLFRERFPKFYFPLDNAYPRILEYYGAKINIYGFKITSGRKDYYTEGEDVLYWRQGNCYFAMIELERGNLGLEFLYQNKGIIRESGRVYVKSNLGFIGFSVSLDGFTEPYKYVSGGLSLWIKGEFSPLFTVRNLSYDPSDLLKDPVYYLGLHYAY